MAQQQAERYVIAYLSDEDLQTWRDIIAEGNAIGQGGVQNFDYEHSHEHWMRQFEFIGALMERFDFDSEHKWDISVYDGAVRVLKPAEEETSSD